MRSRMALVWVCAMFLFVSLVSCGGGGGGGGVAAVFTVGGTVSGLTGTVVLQNNGADDLSIISNGTFTFATKVANSGDYSVTVLTQPAGKTCTVNSGVGRISDANVINVSVVCSANAYAVGGTVSGLTGTGLVLQNNGADSLAVPAGSTSFTFSTNVANGAAYAVSIKTQPTATGQFCSVSGGSGVISGAAVTNVAVTCINKIWHHPASLTDNISPDGQNVSAPQTAMDDAGNTVVVWTQDYTSLPACGNGGSSPCYGIFKSEFRNGLWTQPTTSAVHISPVGLAADSPSVAMDNNGNALIVWKQFDASGACIGGDCPSVYRSEYRAGSWSTPTSAGVLAAGTNQYASTPRAAMDDNGNALIVWRQAWSGGDGIFMSEYRTGVWTQPTSTANHISPSGSGQTAQNPQVAMDNNGNAIIVWQQSDGSANQIFKSEYRSGVWTHPTTSADNISPNGQGASVPQVAMDNLGNAIIIWLQSDGAVNQVYKSEYRSGAWTHPTNLATDHISLDSVPAGEPQLAMDNNGNAIIAWLQQDDTAAAAVFKSEYRSGVWKHPAGRTDNVSPASNNMSGPRLSMDDNGNALLVWVQNDDTANIPGPPGPPPFFLPGPTTYRYLQIYKAEYRNGAWTVPSGLTDNISIDGKPADSPAVAMGKNGDAIIVQRQSDGLQNQIFKSEYR